MSFSANALQAWNEVDSTGPNGVPLINGTQTILSYTFPDDGKLHCFVLEAGLQVTILEVGGVVAFTYTTPAGNLLTATIFAAGLAPGYSVGLQGRDGVALGGSQLLLRQTTALTSGAAKLYGHIMAD